MSYFNVGRGKWVHGLTDHDATLVHLSNDHSLWVVKHGAFTWCNLLTHQGGDVILSNWHWWPGIIDLPRSHRNVPCVVRLDDQRVLGCFNDSTYHYFQVITANNDGTITGGTRVRMQLQDPMGTITESSSLDMALLTDGRVLILYDGGAGPTPTGDQRLKGRIITVSGTTVSVGGAQDADGTPWFVPVSSSGDKRINLAANAHGVLAGITYQYEGTMHAWLRWYTVSGDTLVRQDSVELNSSPTVKLGRLDDVHFVVQVETSATLWHYVSVIGDAISAGPELGPVTDPAGDALNGYQFWYMIPTGANSLTTALKNAAGNVGVYMLSIDAHGVVINKRWQTDDPAVQPDNWFDIALADAGMGLVTWVYNSTAYNNDTDATLRLCRVAAGGTAAVQAGTARAIRVFGREKTKRSREYSG